MLISGVVVYTIDVFGGVVEHGGQVFDSGYEMGDGWDVKFPALIP